MMELILRDDIGDERLTTYIKNYAKKLNFPKIANNTCITNTKTKQKTTDNCELVVSDHS